MMENGLKIRGCMKKNVFLIVCLLCGMSAYGQNWNYGIEIGYMNSRFHAHDPDVSCGHGFKVGGMVDYTFRNNILIETGLSYERKSGKIQGGPLANYGISEINVRDMDYLVFPVSFGYTFNLCKDLVFIPQVGWYFSAGLRGSGFLSGKDSFGQPYTSAIDVFPASYDRQYRPFDRFDTGALFGVNLQYRKVRLKAFYELGVKTINPVYGNLRNRTAGASVCCVF